MSKLSFPPSGYMGDGAYVDSETTTDPGNDKVVASMTVPAGESRKLHLAHVANGIPGEIKIELNSDLIGSGLISPAETNKIFHWIPARPLVEGDLIEVKFKQRPGTPVQTIRTHLMAEES